MAAGGALHHLAVDRGTHQLIGPRLPASGAGFHTNPRQVSADPRLIESLDTTLIEAEDAALTALLLEVGLQFIPRAKVLSAIIANDWRHRASVLRDSQSYCETVGAFQSMVEELRVGHSDGACTRRGNRARCHGSVGLWHRNCIGMCGVGKVPSLRKWGGGPYLRTCGRCAALLVGTAYPQSPSWSDNTRSFSLPRCSSSYLNQVHSAGGTWGLTFLHFSFARQRAARRGSGFGSSRTRWL